LRIDAGGLPVQEGSRKELEDTFTSSMAELKSEMSAAQEKATQQLSRRIRSNGLIKIIANLVLAKPDRCKVIACMGTRAKCCGRMAHPLLILWGHIFQVTI